MTGEMVEWFKAAVLKTAEVQASGGSNPSLSAIYFSPSNFWQKENLLFKSAKSRWRKGICVNC